MENKIRIALLIDADNAPASAIEAILSELATLGETHIRRAYGNWKKPELKGWEDCLHEHAIRPMQQFDYTKGKNSSDMAMIIDALELLYTDRPEAFGIVSSDSDFTPLVMHLRAKGAAVYGFGAGKTPKPFVNACSRFLNIETLTEAKTELRSTSSLRIPTNELRMDTKLVKLLRSAATAAADENGWAKVGAVGSQIANQASFDARNYGYASLSKLLLATELFEFQNEGNSAVAIRDKRQHKAESPASPIPP
jgi:uncharacterized LabA/DUF88 family protein